MNHLALVNYWQEVAKHDLKTMESLFRSRRYSDSLFFGHLVLEKILKAAIVAKTKTHPKFLHNLLVLATDSAINFSDTDLEFLSEVNKFNIRARYPDYKLNFY
jgi:HEPN domain-containing protein